MAIEIINKTGGAFPVTRQVGSSADHAALPNNCYFEQIDLNYLVRYKDATGAIADAFGSSILQIQKVFVDPVNGNDSTGAVNRFDKPYLTYNAASTAALALAPTISTPALVVLRKGVYTDNMLLKPYVYVHCDEGVVFTFGGFYDDANTVFCRVYGKACFYVNGRPLNQLFGSNIYLEFDRADMEMTTPLSTIFSSSASATATLTVVCNSIDTNGANALVISLRYGVNAIIYVRDYLQGPRRPITTM